MTRFSSLVLIGACVPFTGCIVPPPPQQPGTEQVSAVKALKDLPPPPKPPPVPAKQNVPIDAVLRERARQEIISAAQSSDEIVRCQAMEAAQIGLGEQGAVVILPGMDDSKPLVRFAAAMAAGSVPLESARMKLHILSQDADPSVKIAARYGLHKLGDTSRSHDLEAYAVSVDPVVRRNTVMALGLLGEKSAVVILWPMQLDIDPAVRLQVAEALWRLGDDVGLKNCVAGVVSQFPDEQIVCTLALAAPKDRRVRPYLLGKLTTPYDELNLAAARALGIIGSDEGYGVAIKGAASTDPRQRALAALAFGAIGRTDSQAMLAKMLADPDPFVRVAAAAGVLQVREQ